MEEDVEAKGLELPVATGGACGTPFAGADALLPNGLELSLSLLPPKDEVPLFAMDGDAWLNGLEFPPFIPLPGTGELFGIIADGGA